MKKELEGLERCPLCGHKLKIEVSEKKKQANLANLATRKNKGGRPKGSKNKQKA